MKILLTGASGLLGRSLMDRLAPLAGSPGDLIGTARSRVKPPLRHLDLTDEHTVRTAFAELSPRLVVHSAAERRPDVVDGDPAAAERINVDATALLAALAAANGAAFIYISTDYVFDGSSPPYAVDAKPSQLNAYGRMKLAGEEVVRAAYLAAGTPSFAILRIPILYGQVETLGESPVTELAVKLLEGRPLTAEDWAMRYPAHADDVAEAVATVAAGLTSDSMPRFTGIFHFAGREQLTKYGMARVIADALGADAALVRADPNPPAGAPRPKDCRLDSSRLDALGFTPRIRFAEGIRAALAPFVRG
ncbi:dTDP-4-dehydrorhamnose reductase family protein [Propionivibrio soli]|uniref:dTDP-4-dehydrorhamnose reductase family protein n=1 Tax=Propionivibrio soli TaxID=2976531 RepID=UPI0021E8EDB1|nr:SDR family oxidoreductase [Propionivibrio soli]